MKSSSKKAFQVGVVEENENESGKFTLDDVSISRSQRCVKPGS